MYIYTHFIFKLSGDILWYKITCLGSGLCPSFGVPKRTRVS